MLPLVIDPNGVVSRILTEKPISLSRVMPRRREGHMEYWMLEISGGKKLFLKIATGARTRQMIKDEVYFYENVSDKPYLPAYYGGVIAPEYTALVIEDLSHCHWPPPWKQDSVDETLKSLHAASAISDAKISRKILHFKDYLLGWHKISDVSNLVRLNICTEEWFNKNISRLKTLSEQALHESDELIHFDVRSDNICFKDRQPILIDWAWYCRGAFDLQVVSWALTLSLEEGGIRPEQLLPDVHPRYVALLAGYFAQFIGTDCVDGSHVRALQLKQLQVAMKWLQDIL